MRDIAVTLVIFGTLPFILKYPWVGVMAYAWISLFNPHNWAYGFALGVPYAMIVAVTTFVAMAGHWKTVRLPITPITVLLMLLLFWMTVTLAFALNFLDSLDRWMFVCKVFIFTLVAASLLHSRKQLEALLWVVAASVGFYGVKGGVFTIVTGGTEKVYGPPGTSFISDNNAIPVALIMVIPLVYYLSTTVSRKWVKLTMYGAMFLSSVAVLGSQSRGAFLAIAAAVIFLWIKSRRKAFLGVALACAIPVAIGFMSEKWTERMESTKNYEEDSSAQGRLNAWEMAFNLANDRPLVGGGFEIYDPVVFARYAPNPLDVHAAHSIYFQMLGEHGYVGLGLFLLLGIVTWRTANRIIRESRDRPDFLWANDLARAIQVSFIGFAVGGAFINIAYWDVQYYLAVVVMVVNEIVRQSQSESGATVFDDAAPGDAQPARMF